MAHAPLPLFHRGFGGTERRDAWWLQPLVVFVVLGGFVVYATWAAFQNAYYTSGPYLSPFYSPELWGDPRTAWFGAKPGWWPGLLPFSPALIILFILAHDAWRGMWFDDGAGGRRFGIGFGTIVLTLNVVLLTCYTLGCHSMRHLAGGFLDQLSRHPVRKKAYDCSSCLNRWQMKWAWMSLIGVAFTDLYVRMCAMGIWHDWRIIG